MNIYFAIILCFLPFVLCFVCFLIFSKNKLFNQILVSLFGLIAVLPVTFVQFYFDRLMPLNHSVENSSLVILFVKILIFNGILEEGVKFLLLAATPNKNLSVANFFSLSLLLGLSLGCFESVIYFLQHLQAANERGAQLVYKLIFKRIFLTDMVHMFCAGLCGLTIYSLKNKEFDLLPVIFAIAVHTAFDFFTYFDNSMQYLSYIALAFGILECRIHYSKYSNIDSSDNETIIVFERNDEKEEKRQKLNAGSVKISPVKPEDNSGFWKLDDSEKTLEDKLPLQKKINKKEKNK